MEDWIAGVLWRLSLSWDKFGLGGGGRWKKNTLLISARTVLSNHDGSVELLSLLLVEANEHAA
jgi:hypothetical protein